MSIYQVIDFFHDSAHTIGFIISGDFAEDHTHDILENLENHENDTKKNKYLLDKNHAKIASTVEVVDELEITFNFISNGISKDQMIGSNYKANLDRPPIL